MRASLLIVILVTTAANVVGYVILPDRVAVHFGVGGDPDSWADKTATVLIMEGMALFMFALFWTIPWMVMWCPAWLVNLPNKDYWLRADMRPATRKKLESLMGEYGTAILAFLLLMGVLVADANLADPVRLKESYFLPLLIVFLVYTGFWCFKILYSFKRPRDAADLPPAQ
jgi:uncharacterized membrane protein